MNPAADQDLLLYSALPNDPDCKNEYLLPQSIQEERGFFQDPSLSYSFPSTSQPGILQGSWHPTSAQADHALDGWFDRDWVLFPDTPDPVEQPDDIMEISVVLSSYGSLEEAQFRVDRHVQRALQQRHLEAQSGKNKCPANAFILYRIGFQCVAEEFYSTKCQQLVSRICGKSWQLESDDVKAWFQQQATIQKAKYTQAFEHA